MQFEIECTTTKVNHSKLHAWFGGETLSFSESQFLQSPTQKYLFGMNQRVISQNTVIFTLLPTNWTKMNLLYMILSSLLIILLFIYLFIFWRFVNKLSMRSVWKKKNKIKQERRKDKQARKNTYGSNPTKISFFTEPRESPSFLATRRSKPNSTWNKLNCVPRMGQGEFHTAKIKPLVVQYMYMVYGSIRAS